MRSLRLRLELLRWRAAGRQARLWWRDDDACGPSPELDWLLRIAGRRAVPLTLAVIPRGDLEGLATTLAQAANVSVVQHGVDHQNRRTGPQAGEFPHDWPRSRLAAALRRGRRDLAPLPQRLAVFTPPWNDIHPELEAALADAGYAGWSAAGELAGTGTGEAVARVDAHLDLMRWKGGARFRGEGRFQADLAHELARRRRAGRWAAPIGLLTHHQAHDASAWAFLERFLDWSAGEPALAWVGLEALLDEMAAKRRGALALVE